MGVVMTTPSVPYIINFNDGSSETISCVSEWPLPAKGGGFQVMEPIVKVDACMCSCPFLVNGAS